MSLFGSIHLAGNALRAQDIGLQVVGQNIANANTPGYIREEVVLKPAPTQRIGDLLLGLGVSVAGIIQKLDTFTEDRLRGATSDLHGADIQEQALKQLEGLLGELGKTDLATSLNGFFQSIQEVLNQPESPTVRNLAVLRGKTLTQDINRLANRVATVRSDLNNRVGAIAGDINRLTEQIRDLNVRIAETEGGDTSGSDAVGLRDQRNQALGKLAELVDIRVTDQPGGGVAVFVGGDYLVFEGLQRNVRADLSSDRGLSVYSIKLEDTNAPLELSGGELFGLTTARDSILGGFLDQLDTLSNTLAFEFNKVYASGQGLSGYASLTSEHAVDNIDASLDAAGLTNTPVNGTFQVLVRNKQTGLTKTSNVQVDLNGLDQDTTLRTLAAQLNAINGISATITPQRKLQIASMGADLEFGFANDTSGLLAALGINTFFSGTSATGLGINAAVAADPTKFAASRNGIGEDTDNAVDLAGFIDQPLDTHGGVSISVLFSRLVADTTQASAVAQATAEGYRVFHQSIQGQALAASGVSIDEEAIKMLAYQRAYQATAKFIATLDELLKVLVNL